MACFLDPETNKYLTEEEKIRVETEIIKFLNKEEKESLTHFDKEEEKRAESKSQRNDNQNNENLVDNFAKICCFDDFESKKIRSRNKKQKSSYTGTVLYEQSLSKVREYFKNNNIVSDVDSSDIENRIFK